MIMLTKQKERKRLYLILRGRFKGETSLKSGMKVDRRGSSFYSMEKRIIKSDNKSQMSFRFYIYFVAKPRKQQV